MPTNDDSEGADPLPGYLARPSLSQFFAEHPRLISDLRRFDLAQLAGTVGGLLADPDWQASNTRLEVLQHFIVATADAKVAATLTHFEAWLTQLGQGTAGQLEDPAEDVFVSKVTLPDRDCLIFPGTYEASAYNLQLFINLLEYVPKEDPYAGLRRAVHALLDLSNAVAARTGVRRYAVGEVIPHKSISSGLLRDFERLGSRVRFTHADLTQLGIDPADLTTFVFDLTARDTLCTELLGHSTLERLPILWIDGCYYLALPTAVSMGIRRAVIELCISLGVEETLYRAYTDTLAGSFSGIPLLGGIAAPELPFQRQGTLFVAELFRYIDRGHLLHLCFVVDDFLNYAKTQMAHADRESARFREAIDHSLSETHRIFTQQPDFREAVSVIVGCPWGRPMVVEFTAVKDPRWRVVTFAAADLTTLSWLPKFSPLDLYRVLDLCDQLTQLNVVLVNHSGFLNLYDWLRSLDVHLKGHPTSGDGGPPSPDRPLQILIPQNGLLGVRKESLEAWNPHRANTWDGRKVQVQRYEAQPVSQAGDDLPFYISVDDIHAGKLIAVFETERRGWWATVETPNSSDGAMQYRLWHASSVWISKAAPVLELYLTSLPDGPIAWICRYEDSIERQEGETVPDRDTARALLCIEVQQNVVQLTARQGFLASLRNPTNLTESLLVEGLILGALRLSGSEETPETVDRLAREIIPGPWARDVHAFEAQDFRQFLHRAATAHPLVLNSLDDTCTQLGLGWSNRKPSENATLVGIEECCEYLNQTIETVWERVRARLKGHRREPLLTLLARNYELIMAETGRWLNTSRAIISLYGDSAATARGMAERMSSLDTGALSSRILMEMALCECPVSSGAEAGLLDISRLLADVFQVYGLGSSSEAIRYGSQKAEVKISTLGAIDTHSEFAEQVAGPYGASLSVRRVQLAVEGYEENFQQPDLPASAQPLFDSEFWAAWTEAFGFTVDDLRTFMDVADAEGMRLQEPTFVTNFEALCSLCAAESLQTETVRRILNTLTLQPRESWSTTPLGFAPRDWYPWRYRRRLSVISRPILQLDSSDDPRYLIAPGVLRDSVRKVLEYCHGGGYEAKDFPPGRMRSWIGSAENKRGHQFNTEVAERLRELGWQTQENIRLTAILNAKLDRNYGDVDVLAWRGTRVLAIECKDLELARTLGEIGRQLHEFRGELAHGKPDRLKKHLMRIDLLNTRAAAVNRFTKSASPVQIEGWLIFSDLVPLQFSRAAKQHRISLGTLADLEKL